MLALKSANSRVPQSCDVACWRHAMGAQVVAKRNHEETGPALRREPPCVDYDEINRIAKIADSLADFGQILTAARGQESGHVLQ